MDKLHVFEKFRSLVATPTNVGLPNELVERKPTEEELELINIMLKLPPAKQELWFTAFKTIWEYESDILKN